jgi:hypothetical protein
MPLFLDWLPPLIDMSQCASEDEEAELAYEYFVRDLLGCSVKYGGKPLEYTTHMERGKEKAFWHLVTEDHYGFREYRRNRAASIGYVSAIINNCDDPHVSLWDYTHRGRVRRYLWLEPYYVVVLEETSFTWKLITAFPTDRPYTQRDLSSQRAKVTKPKK